MRILLTFACLFFALLSASAQEKDSIRFAMENYDYDTALRLINKDTMPSLPLLYQKGFILRQQGEAAAALAVFQDIMRQDTSSARPFIEAAECCRALAKNKLAMAYYRKATLLAPDNKYARMQYIRQLLLHRLYQESLQESSTLAERDSSAAVLHLVGMSLEGLRDTAAIPCYREIHRRYPTDYLSVSKLCQYYLATNDFEHAIALSETYRRQQDSTNVIVNQLNAQAYCMNRDYPTAILRYRELLQQGDSSFCTCYYMGISCYATEDFEYACRMLEVARREKPQDINLLYYLGRSYEKSFQGEEGSLCLEEAISYTLVPDSAMNRLYSALADCYYVAGRYRDQAEILKIRYKEYDRENHLILYNLALLYQTGLKDPDTAMHYLEAFLQTRPKEEPNAPEAVIRDGNVIPRRTVYYRAAEKWLKDLQKHKKVEDFFQGKPAKE